MHDQGTTKEVWTSDPPLSREMWLHYRMTVTEAWNANGGDASLATKLDAVTEALIGRCPPPSWQSKNDVIELSVPGSGLVHLTVKSGGVHIDHDTAIEMADALRDAAAWLRERGAA